MSRKLVQTVASMTAKQLRVAVAMLAALALGVGGAAAAVGSLNTANVANETVATETVTADPQLTEDDAESGDAALTGGDEESGDEADPSSDPDSDDEGTATVSDRNQTDCMLPADLLVTKAEVEAAANDGEQSGEPTEGDTTEGDTEGDADDPAADTDTEAELPTYRNHGEFVSSIARNKDLARHAEAVRAAAQSDCGKPMVSVKGSDDAAAPTDEDAELSQLSVEAESTTKRSAKADNGKRGNGHAKGKAHGQGNGR